MANSLPNLLDLLIVREALRKAWQDSQPGIDGGHEEGGFIVQNAAGDVDILRWPKGGQDSILLPAYNNCQVNGHDILATFHTHPNTGPAYLQEPSETDRWAVWNDPDLKGKLYSGEFVVTADSIYLIAPDGLVSELGTREDLLAGIRVTLLEDVTYLEGN